MDILDAIPPEDLLKVVFLDRFTLGRRSPEQKRALLDLWVEQLLSTTLTMPEPRSGPALFFRSLVRDDYKTLFHKVIAAADLPGSLIIEDYVAPTQAYNFDASCELADSITVVRKLGLDDPVEAAACAVKLIHYGMIVRALTSYDFDTLVTFSDMQPVEHLATLYFKAQGKATVSLQHGLYIDYGEVDTVNVINYKHQPSDHFLAWGQHTAELIKTHNPDTNVVICGKPDLTPLKRRNGYAGNEDGEILVVMDQEIFQAQNIAMLKLVNAYAERQNKQVRIRFHPHNNKPYYRKIFPNLQEKRSIEDASIVVGHTSSVLFEAAALGLPTLQYKSDTPTIPLAGERQFTDDSSLQQAMGLARLPQHKHHIQSIIDSIAEQSSAKYRAFFQALKAMPETPRFSVIVPCFNSGQHVSTVLDSILSQTFQNLEVIIADGLSTDYTLQIAADYAERDPRVKIISQADSGVYDAMNNGLARATGDWVIFMGSDDAFAKDTVLQEVADFADINPDAGMIYGSVRVVGDVKWAKDGTIYDGAFSIEKIQSKNICHQAIFYRRSDHIEIGEYNLKYKLCADWDMNLRFWARKPCKFIDLIIANFNAGGASTAGTDPEFGKDFVANKKKYFSQSGMLHNA